MRYQIHHSTTYKYDASVSISHHEMRLRPRESRRQRLIEHALSIEPNPRDTKLRDDYFGNPTYFAIVEGAHSTFEVHSKFVMDVTPPRTLPPNETPAWERVRECARGIQLGPALEANEFLFDSPLIKIGDNFANYAKASFAKGRPILEAVLDLTERIFEEFTFDSTATDISTPLAQVLKEKRGVCQDFAHLQVACLRSLGLPARYVSGYINTRPPPGKPKLFGADASHAWVSFYCDGLGWIDVDPTNNQMPTNEHIVVAWGRDYSDVSPIRGVTLGGSGHSLDVSVDVRAVEDVQSAQDGRISPA